MKKAFIPICLLFFIQSISLRAQSENDTYASAVSSIDSIMFHLYDVISGDAGVKRNWELFHYLFIPEARLIPSGVNQQGEEVYKIITPAEYHEMSGNYLEEKGFTEKEIHRVTQQFGSLAHIFSTYESYHKSTDIDPFDRGINSIQLFYSQSRWWIVSIYWNQESEENRIPLEYMPEK
jgi:hypothetical protein